MIIAIPPSVVAGRKQSGLLRMRKRRNDGTCNEEEERDFDLLTLPLLPHDFDLPHVRTAGSHRECVRCSPSNDCAALLLLVRGPHTLTT